MKISNFNVKLYQALENPDKASTFFQKHVKVLHSFGVEGVSSITNSWKNNPTVWLFALENELGEMIGGVRLDIKSGFKMPLEDALSNYSKVLKQARRHELEGGVAELCGLWIDKEHRKANLAIALMKAAIATAPNIGVRHIMGFANEHSLKTTNLMGFKEIDTVENNGVFYYPDERYRSVLIEMDAFAFKPKQKKDGILIEDLRQHLKQAEVAYTHDGIVMINYNLETEPIRIRKLAQALKLQIAA